MSLTDGLVERDEARRFLEEFLADKAVSDAPRLLLVLGKGGSGRSGIVRLAREVAQRQGRFGLHNIAWNLPYATSHEYLYNQLCPNTAAPLFSYLAEYRHLRDLLPQVEARVERAQLELGWPILALDPGEWPATLLADAPDNVRYRTVQALPPKALHYLIRKLYSVLSTTQLSEQAAAFFRTGLEHIIQLTATNLNQLRAFVEDEIKNFLTPGEFELYLNPPEGLAQAVGRGLAGASQTKPLLFIVDDYRPGSADNLWLNVIETSGRSLWLMVATERPAWNEKLEGVTILQPQPLSIVGAIQYFQTTYQREIAEPVVETLVRISRGTPLSLLLAIDLYANGARLADIEQAVALTPDYPLEGLLIQLLEDDKRFGDDEMAQLQLLAILRDPAPKFMTALHQQMSEAGFEDNPQALANLVAKCPALFDVTDGTPRLHPSIQKRLRHYLSVERRRFSRSIQEGILEPARTAAVKLLVNIEEKLVSATTGGSLSERANNAEWGNAVQDVAYYRLWLDEAVGWNFMLPRWLIAYTYNPTLARQLIEVAASLEQTFYTEGAELMPILRSLISPIYGTGSKNLDEKLKALEVLDSLSTPERGRWYKAENLGKRPTSGGSPEAEVRGIVRWLQARVYEEAGQYDRAASLYEGVLATNVKMPQLEQAAARTTLYLSTRYLLKGGQERALSAISRGAELAPDFYEAQLAAFAQAIKLKRFEPALNAADRLANLNDPLGDLYTSFALWGLNRQEEALTEARTWLGLRPLRDGTVIFKALLTYSGLEPNPDFAALLELLSNSES